MYCEAACPACAAASSVVEVVEVAAGRRGSSRSRGACVAVIVGSATTIRPSTESASGTPLRSRIVAALGGSVDRDRRPRRAAIAAYAFGSTPWSWNSRAPKTDSTIAMTHEPEPQPQQRARRAGCRAARGRPARRGSTAARRRGPVCLGHRSTRPVLAGRWAAAGRTCPYASPRPCRRAGRRGRAGGVWPAAVDDDRRRAAGSAGFAGRQRVDPQASSAGGRGRACRAPCRRRAEERRAGRRRPCPAPAPARRPAAGRAARRAPSAATARWRVERVGLLLQRGGRERRLLHRGVEHQQPDHPPSSSSDTRVTNGTGRRGVRPPRHDGEPGPLDRGLGEARDPGAGPGSSGLLIGRAPLRRLRSVGADAFDGAQPHGGGARVLGDLVRRRPSRRRG